MCSRALRAAIRAGTATVVPERGGHHRGDEEAGGKSLAPELKRVINGTGVVIHTNLGRIPLAESVIDRVTAAASGYSNLEYNLEAGTRGDRYQHCLSILSRLTGAEGALIVNNNAAAVLLALNTLAEGREVIISRGELIEIGGSFRIPEVMRKSGAILREVGTTNRTFLEDYERAIGPNTGLIMKAHTSNYRIKGFVHEVTSEELTGLSRGVNVPFFYDIGSGLFSPLGNGVPDSGEPTVSGEMKKGVGIISFSGDKLLGGPQAGIIRGPKRPGFGHAKEPAHKGPSAGQAHPGGPRSHPPPLSRPGTREKGGAGPPDASSGPGSAERSGRAGLDGR